MGSDFAGITHQFADRIEPGAAADIRLVHTLCRQGSKIPHHRHDSPFLSFLLSGTYFEGQKNHWDRCTPNSLTWHPAGDAHEVRHGNVEVSSLQLEFLQPSFNEAIAFKSLPTKRLTGDIPAARPALLAMMREMEVNDEFSAMSIRGYVLQTLSLIGRGVARQQYLPATRLVARIKEAVYDSFPQAPAIDALANSLGLSVSQMETLYRRQTGESIGFTARRLRISRACELLTEPERPLSQIALDCGFYDQSHFNRTFSRYMNCTPGDFRKSHEHRGLAS